MIRNQGDCSERVVAYSGHSLDTASVQEPQTVPGGRKIWRVSALLRDAPSIVEVNVALLPSLKLKVAVPTSVKMTFDDSKATALNGGPLLRYSLPE